MPIETEVLPFGEWLSQAPLSFAAIAFGVTFFALVVSYLVAAVRHGPIRAGDMTYRVVSSGVLDLIRMSPRRVLALARLAIQESVRRRVWTVLVVFAIILLFAGWFLDPRSADPARLYLSFVLTATSYLVCLLALFLSAFSIPADIKNRTIYTIVTKPVRAGEIVLGRMLGFTAVGTVLLAIMGLTSYIFVTRALSHTHTLTVEDLAPVGTDGALTGQTELALGHRHFLTIRPGEPMETEIEAGHWHIITQKDDGTYELGPHQDMLIARVPMRGTIRFLERNGQVGKGVNVGNEWEYRQFIEGGSLAAAIWTFDGITRDRFPDNRLPLEMTIRVFRTYVGNIEKGIQGSLTFVNPTTQEASQAYYFTAKDLEVDRQFIELDKLKDSKGNDIDFFDKLVDNGRVEIKLQCLDGNQYFGVAQADMWLRAGDRPFWLNFVKGYIGIWLQMTLIVGLGVMFSTFLSGAVAMIATIGAIILGFFTSFVFDLATSVLGERTIIHGGGPIESGIRLITQANVMTELEDSLAVRVAKMADQFLMFLMDTVARVVPDFSVYDTTSYVAYGFDISGADLLLRNVLIALAYLLAMFITGFFFLKTREVAR